MFSSLITRQILSPNYNPRINAKYNPSGKVVRITPHHTAYVGSAESIANTFVSTARQASCNYAIGNDGEIIGVVDEDNRAWTTSSPENDYIAITVEISNSEYGYPWHVSNKAIKSFINLAVDICKRHGIGKVDFTGDTSGNITIHRWFASTQCCGDYLVSKIPSIAKKINDNLKGGEEMTAEEKAYVQNLEKRITELEGRANVKYAWIDAKKDAVPEWAKSDIQYLYNKGFLKGEKGTGSLALSYIELRVLCVISRVAQKIIK